MNTGKIRIVLLVLCVLFITSAVGCSALQSLGEWVSNLNSPKNAPSSELAVVELGNIWLFDEKNSTVGISYTLRPGPKTKYDKYYDVKISWGKRIVSRMAVQFQSPDHEFRGMPVSLEGAAAEQFIELLTETSEYQEVLIAFENLREEKRRSHQEEEELVYNLFWEGEAPDYKEYKKAMEQIQDMDAREKQIIQEFYEFPYSARLPDSFVNSLELVVAEWRFN